MHFRATASGDGRALRLSIPSAARLPPADMRLKARGFASPAFADFALSRRKAFRSRQDGLAWLRSCHQNWQSRCFANNLAYVLPTSNYRLPRSNTFAGIAPSSVLPFIAAQVLGGIVAVGVIKALYPAITPADAADVIVPHDQAGSAATQAAHDGTSPSADRPPGQSRPY